MRSSLTRFQLQPPMSEAEKFELRKRAWREQGIAIFDIEQIPGWDTRQLIQNYAEALYGKRQAAKACDHG